MKSRKNHSKAYLITACLGAIVLLSCQPVEDDSAVIELDITNPTEFLDRPIDPGGAEWYRISTSQVRLLYVAANLEDSDADIVIEVLGSEQAILGQTNSIGLNRSLSLVLEPGSYEILAKDITPIPYPPGSYFYDFLFDSFDITGLGSIGATNPIAELLGIMSLVEVGDYCYFYFDVTATGDIALSCEPDFELDLSFELYHSPLIAVGDTFNPDHIEDSGVIGQAEQWNINASPGRYFLRVIAEEASGLATSFDISMQFSE